MSKPKRKQPSIPRDKGGFRAHIEQRLVSMGYRASHITWQSSPARLLVIIRGEFKMFRLSARSSVADINFQLGRLQTWAEIAELRPESKRPVVVPIKRDVMQLDLIEAVAAAEARA